MKSRKLGIWQEGKRSKTGNWLGQACGKSRQPNKPLMEVPRRQTLPLHPALPALSSWEDLVQRSCASGFQGKHSRSTFSPVRLRRRCRWHAGSNFPGKQRGWQPQPVTLSSICGGQCNSTERILQPRSFTRETQIRWLHSLKNNWSSVLSCPLLLKLIERQTH